MKRRSRSQPVMAHKDCRAPIPVSPVAQPRVASLLAQQESIPAAAPRAPVASPAAHQEFQAEAQGYPEAVRAFPEAVRGSPAAAPAFLAAVLACLAAATQDCQETLPLPDKVQAALRQVELLVPVVQALFKLPALA